MGLRLFFLPNFPGAMFIQGGTFIPDSRVESKSRTQNSKKLLPSSVVFKLLFDSLLTVQAVLTIACCMSLGIFLFYECGHFEKFGSIKRIEPRH